MRNKKNNYNKYYNIKRGNRRRYFYINLLSRIII